MANLEGGTRARLDIACEQGGGALSDSRPDADRLRKISEITSGKYADVQDISSLPTPPSYFIDETRTALPIAPTWVWAALGAALFGAHWLSARQTGLR